MATTRAQHRALGAAAPSLNTLSDRPTSAASRHRRVTMVEVPDESLGYERSGSADLEIPGSFAASPVVVSRPSTDEAGLDSDELDERLAEAHISTWVERTDDESCPPEERTAGEPAYPKERTGTSPYPAEYLDSLGQGHREYPNSDSTFGRTSTPRTGTDNNSYDASTTPFQTPSRKARGYAKTPSVKISGARFFGNAVVNVDTSENDEHVEPEVEQKSDETLKQAKKHKRKSARRQRDAELEFLQRVIEENREAAEEMLKRATPKRYSEELQKAQSESEGYDSSMWGDDMDTMHTGPEKPPIEVWKTTEVSRDESPRAGPSYFDKGKWVKDSDYEHNVAYKKSLKQTPYHATHSPEKPARRARPSLGITIDNVRPAQPPKSPRPITRDTDLNTTSGWNSQ
ncbi:hypothetical protein FRC12_016224 [Ceratobasidium sp. 428]|nr:hypothetical protein FRC12_016224 [Ceratobasidium sp. 428]